MPAAWNVAKGWLVTAAISALLGLLGYAIGDVRLASVFAGAGLLLCFTTYWMAERAIIGMLGARELPEGEAPAFHASVASLAGRAGIVKPRVYLIERGPPVGLVAGRGIAASSLAVTAGTLALPPAEVDGIIAHEVAHIRRRDIVIQTPVVVFSAALLDVTRVGGWLARPLLYILGPIAAALQHVLLSPKRELAADRLAADLCDSPHGLADALIRLERAAELVEFEASPATEPVFTIDPFEDDGLAALFGSHPRVSTRVERLRSLDPGWREKIRDA